MSDKIFVIDRSDTRNLYLRKILESNGNMVFDFGENIFYPAGHIVYIFAPAKKIDVDIAKTLRASSTVFFQQITGAALDDFLLKDITAIKITDDEIFAYKNARLTAEGVLPIVISNTQRSLSALKILVIGLGRVGKCIAKIFTDLNCSITAVTTKEEEKYISSVYIGDNYIELSSLGDKIGDYDVIINTVPKRVLTNDILSRLSTSALLVDISSSPYGEDKEHCHQNGINLIIAPSLPAIVAPYDAAVYLAERIYRGLSLAI